MGILNVTPDSFSDGGLYNNESFALQHALEMIKNGADVIDIGGESTRPGHDPVSVDEEIARIVPVVESLAAKIKVPISVDTYKAQTAERAVDAGATIINDIWGAKKDPEIADVAAAKGVPIILMHNRDNRNYNFFIRDVLQDLYESISIAKKAGVPDENIILDPGIGFAKDYKENMEMMRNLDKLVGLGYPVLLATSRKRMIGEALDLPVDERVEGTGATVCYGIQKGCHMVRVHDVKEVSRMAAMMDALVKRGANNVDKIYLNQLEFYGYHGVLPEENRLGQRFIVDLIIESDLKEAGVKDDLAKTINYADVYEDCRRIVEKEKYELIEAIAEKLASVLLSKYELIKRVTVKVVKPDPPIPGHYHSVAVEIIREKL